MSNFLRDSGEIENVLVELENGVSEGDSIVFDNNLEIADNDDNRIIFDDNLGDGNDISEVDKIIANDNLSELEDNVEVEDYYSSEADDTDADPDYYPSNMETRDRNPWSESSEDEEEPVAERKNVSSSNTLHPNLGEPKPVKTNVLGQPSTRPSMENCEDTHNAVASSSKVTILTLNTDDLESGEDPNYKPSSGESSTDEGSDMEIDPEEVTSVLRLQCNAETCTDNASNIVYLSSLEKHKNIIWPKTRNMRGKNGHLWTSTHKTRSSRAPRRNIIHFRQRPINTATNKESPVDCFKLFITPDIINRIVTNTNVEISQKIEKYSTVSATTQPTNATEIEALIGLLVLTAAMKDNHLSSKELFDPAFSGTRYVTVMSKDRFDFLLNCLRFDDKVTRPARRLLDKFAPVRDIWEIFIRACRTNYCPGSYVTIDEQLLGFRGRCPFRMYIPSKPNKYGIKIMMLCDVKTKYLIDGAPYLGKDTNTSGLPLGTFFTKDLTKTIHGSGRNVTMDNWFTSVPLAKDMMNNHNLTIVGTLRGDKKEIPPQMKVSQSRKVDSIMFCYDKDLILVSYKAKKNKMVYLLSTTHEKGTVAERTGKADIVEFYNSTKGAVDTFDEMSSNMSCSRKTRRWPLCIFFGLINSTLVNAYIIYVHNMVANKKKPLCRRDFAKQINEDLTKQHLQARLQVPHLKRHLKCKIEELLGEETPAREPEPVVGRKICAFCPSKKRRMTRFSCFECKKFYCGEHQAKKCVNCS